MKIDGAMRLIAVIVERDAGDGEVYRDGGDREVSPPEKREQTMCNKSKHERGIENLYLYDLV